MQVQLPGVVRDFCPRVSCQCRLSVLSIQPLCKLHTLTSVHMWKDSQHWQPYHCWDTLKYIMHQVNPRGWNKAADWKWSHTQFCSEKWVYFLCNKRKAKEEKENLSVYMLVRKPMCVISALHSLSFVCINDKSSSWPCFVCVDQETLLFTSLPGPAE